jgi:hypothetical protein
MIDETAFQKLIEPVVFPSGIWADYNAVLQYYEDLKGMVTAGIIENSRLPAPPSPSDYTDYVSPRSSFWGEPIPPFTALRSFLR